MSRLIHVNGPPGIGMASTHLGAGHDVVMPQYLGRLDEIEMFETAAHESGAEYVEIVLLDTKDESLRRFNERGTGAAEPWHREVQQLVANTGGVSLLTEMYDRLTDVLHSRAAAVVVPSAEGQIEQTYRALESALGT